jgi:hypothetical protein
MAKVKKWTKRNRRFLNSLDSGCVGAVSWEVTFQPGDPESKNKWGQTSDCDASLSINDEARHLYVTRRGHLRTLQNMRAELDKFEDACVQALADKETHDAPCKAAD